MGDAMSDTWNHRTQFDDPDSKRTQSITEEVHRRRHGEVQVPSPTDSSREEDAVESDDPADKWAARFPDSWTEGN